jgi:tetratricopeptide (TPR) repeat protein
MGGIGKTELVLQYAMKHFEQSTYPGGICWLRARDQEIATQILSYAQAQLGLKIPEQLDLAGQISYCWRNWSEGDALIVLDDVTAYELVEPYLPPADPRFKLLLTTRLKLGSTVKDFPVEELDEGSAIKLLESFVGAERVQSQLDDVKALCKRVGYLPLGLELLGRFLARKPDWTVAKLLEQLVSKSLAAKALIKTEAGMTAQLGVAEALELSWQELNELEQVLAWLLGLFAVSPIPWNLVEQSLGGIEPEELEDIRDAGLINRSLLKRIGQDTYQLHQVVQEYFRIKLHQRSDQGKPLKESFCRVMVAIAQDIDPMLTLNQISGMRNAIAHLEEVANHWSEMLCDQDLAWPCTGVARFYAGQGSYELALLWHEKCLGKCHLRFGSEHPDVANSLDNLAGIHDHQGRYSEAEPLYQQALEISKRLLGPKHPSVATSLNNLACLHHKQGRYEESKLLQQEALEIKQTLLGNEHPSVATSLHNLAGVFRSQGQHQKAEPLYQQALEIRRKLLGNEHPEIAATLDNLAGLYKSQGRYKDAEPLYQQALEMNHKLFGHEHPFIATSFNNLAELYSKQGRFEEAEPLYQQALKMNQRLFGHEHPEVAVGFNNLAELYSNQRRHKEAELLYKKALKIKQKLLGNEHPSVATSFNNLADIYREQGRYTEAELFFKQALEMRQKLLGYEHHDVAISLNNLAGLYSSQGMYEEAETNLKQALGIVEKVLGVSHPFTMTIRNNLSKFYQKWSWSLR